MGFHNTQFPTDISYRSAGGPGFRTNMITLPSGRVIRQGRGSLPRYRYNVAYGIKSYDDLVAVHDFFIARSGGLNTFRFKDHLNHSTDSTRRGTPALTDQVVSASADAGQTTFQLVQRITDGGVTIVRPITKPIASTCLIGVNSVLISDSLYSIDDSTGILTFNSGLTLGDVVTWGGEFDVHAGFGEDTDQLMSASLDDFSSGSIESIIIDEVIDDVQTYDEVPGNGVIEKTITGTVYTVDLTAARLYLLKTTNAVDYVNLPDPDTSSPIPRGLWLCKIINAGASGKTLEIRDHNLNTLVTIDQDEGVMISLTEDAGGNGVWYAL